MIPQEQANAHLQPFVAEPLTLADLASFSPPYRALGELIVPAIYGEKRRSEKVIQKAAAVLFTDGPATDPWKTGEGPQLARLLFGEIHEPWVSAVWKIIGQLPYQSGYNRRPFRSPETDPLDRLHHLTGLHTIMQTGLRGLSVTDVARYGGYQQWQSGHLAPFFAAVLADEKEGPALRSVLADIIQGEDEIGIVNRGMLKGLLMSDEPGDREMVGQLLLAAQRQEGLRQSILESVDQGSVGGLRYMIDLILEHKLARFSSVVRAVDVWFGFNWEAPKQATITRILELARSFLTEPATVKEALRGQDSLAVYVALWSVALRDVEEALLLMTPLLWGEDRIRKLTALYFLSQTNRRHPQVMRWLEEHFGKDPEVDYWARANFPNEEALSDRLFTACLRYAEELPKDGKVYAGTVFGWLTTTVTPAYFYDFIIRGGTKDHLRHLAENLPALPTDTRESLVRKIFAKEYTYYQNATPVSPEAVAALAADPWKRALVRQAAADRNTGVMNTGLRFLGSLELEAEDRALVTSLLRRKSKHLRASLIRIVLGQPEPVLREMITGLLAAGGLDQRLAGLEMLAELHDEDQLLSFVLASAAAYRERKSIGKNETVLLDRLYPKNDDQPSFGNGFGTIDFDKLAPLVEPRLRFGEYTGTPLFADLINADKVARAFAELLQLVKQHGSLEYAGFLEDGSKKVVLLEDDLRYTSQEAYELTGRDRLAQLPAAGVWLTWYDEAELNDFELLYLRDYLLGGTHKIEGPHGDFRKQYFPVANVEVPEDFWFYGGIGSRLRLVLDEFYQQLADHHLLISFQLDVLEDMMARLPAEQREIVIVTRNPNEEYAYEETFFWAQQITGWIPDYDPEKWTFPGQEVPAGAFARSYALHAYLVAATRSHGSEKVSKSLGPLNDKLTRLPKLDTQIAIILYESGILSDNDLRWHALQDQFCFRLLAGDSDVRHHLTDPKLKVPTEVFPPLREQLLKVELLRGELVTEASAYVLRIPYIPGIDHLAETLARLGKESFSRGYTYYSHEISRSSSFSHIIKSSHPQETDTPEAFVALAKKLKLSRQRWFEVAIYAPQWAPWIAHFLQVPDLEIGVWWFHAHASEYMSPLKEKIVAQLTPIAKEDLQQGAIDIDWFHTAYESLGKKNWRLLHAAAKYISDGNGHRQVKTYSAVMLGEIRINETLQKIKEKRDKVYVKALGLIPFSKTNPQADVLRRYKLLQEFIRASKQFGAQRQESEQTAGRIGLENLARNAGYEDSVRFGWIMEAETTHAIMERSIIRIDKVVIQLFIDDSGKADLRISKDGQPQKTIPAKYRKHKAVLELKAYKKDLRQQFSRTRKSLEQAMLNGIGFSKDALRRINLHPVVRPLLAKLVMIDVENEISGFWKDDELVGLDGKVRALADDVRLLIAHPSHLYRGVTWDEYQRYAFERALVQPFKQIFRELYVLTANEREAATESLRYQGHQIQPRKAAALLRGRGWTISESEGLQKVYHQHKVVATMYAAADWYSPAEVEAPVIEAVVFSNRKGNILKLEDLNPVLFSEVMRDIDLVVSVAHVGGVDPEASHSTLQMRGALARESARLFKLDNVEVKQRHVVIDGTLGRYNIHLGSGVVSKGGLQLAIIAVQGQHRGRLFLPFLDDDPKSAEIISKMRLLARDQEIKDPTVLGQLMGK